MVLIHVKSRSSIDLLHIHFQLDCKNTLNDQLLENVTVELEDADGEWRPEHVIPIDNLPYNETKSTYVLMEFPESGNHLTVFISMRDSKGSIGTL